MKPNSIYGWALVAGVAGFLVTMAFHPTGRDFAGGGEAVAHAAARAMGSHGVALASIPITLFGFLGLSRWLRFERPIVSGAFLLYALGSVAVMSAALVSGFVAPGLIRRMTEADETGRAIGHALLAYNFQLNQAYASVQVAASSAAILLWSLALPRGSALATTARILGLVIAPVTLLGLLAGHLRLDVHGFGLVVLTQGVWTLLVAALLLRSGDDVATAAARPEAPVPGR